MSKFDLINEDLKEIESVFDNEHDDDKEIGILFECGHCCIKVINGSKLSFISGFAVLLPEKHDELLMKIFSDGKLVEKQKMKKILIPVNRICAIETDPEEKDDKKED